ncbi:MAG: hypothetical protein ACJ75J_18385 [Cytophagaceae bacterium]|jgi:hypothetical protein
MVKTIDHKDGNSYPVAFGMMALSELCEIEKISLGELNSLSQNMRMSFAITLVYLGLKHGTRKARKEDSKIPAFSKSMEDCADLIDEDLEFLPKVMEVFADSMAFSKKNEGETTIQLQVQPE